MNKSAELKTTTTIVKHILETVPYTRKSDNALIVEVYDYLNPSVTTLPFGMVMSNLKKYNLPSIKTIERSRRRLQGKYQELCPSVEVEYGILMNEDAYKDYALRGIE